MEEQSEQLTKFYQAYLAWVLEGAEAGLGFSRGVGLCTNMYYWLPNDYSLYSELLSEMHTQFSAANLCEQTPFDSILIEYPEESHNKECHKNPARLAWVRSHAGKGK